MTIESLGWLLSAFLLGALPLSALTMRYNRWLRARTVALGGELELKVPRPRIIRMERARFVSMWTVLGLGAVWILWLCAARPSVARGLATCLPWFLLLVMTALFGRDPWGKSYLEFRKHGIVCGAFYFPWENIRNCSWSEKDSTLIIESKSAIMTYQLPNSEKAALLRLLQQRIAEPKPA